MATRRSGRQTKDELPANVTAAFESIRRLKSGGGGRMKEYQIQDEAPIYDEVDEEAYAEIAARKRREAREFLAAGSDDSRDGGLNEELDEEFAYEDQQSVMPTDDVTPDGKRRRRDGSRARRSQRKRLDVPAKVHKLPPAYFKLGAGSTAPGPVAQAGQAGKNDREDDEFIIDSFLDSRMEPPQKDSTANSRRRVHAPPTVRDILRSGMSTSKLREALGHGDDHGMEGVEPIEPEPSYDAPPPSSGDVRADATDKQDAAAEALPFERETPPLQSVERMNAMPPPQAPATSVPDFPAPERPDSTGTAAPPAPSEHRDEETGTEAAQRPIAATRPPPQPRASGIFGASGAPGDGSLENIALLEDGTLLFYWTDLHEVKADGGDRLYLIGKVPVGSVQDGKYATCCLQVGGLERCLYFLPREEMLDDNGRPTGRAPDVINDVHAEVCNILDREVRPEPIRAKVVERSFPFDGSDLLSRPRKYLKVKYPMTFRSLPVNLEGRSFSRVFGTRTSAAERLLVRRRVFGPCWLAVRNSSPVSERLAYTRFIREVSNPKDIEEYRGAREAPLLSVLSLNLLTGSSRHDREEEIIMASGAFVPAVPVGVPPSEQQMKLRSQFTVACAQDRDAAWRRRAPDGVELVPNEAALLNFLLAKLLRLEPDVLVGHDLMGGILEQLVVRMKAHRTRDWSKLGRLVQRRVLSAELGASKSAHLVRYVAADAIAGRLPCDTYLQAKELLPREKDYSLAALAERELGDAAGGLSIQPGSVPTLMRTPDGLGELISVSQARAATALRLAVHMSILPLTKQLTNLSGNVWSRTLRGARAERIEFLLCHEFSRGSDTDVAVKYILPDKLRGADKIAAAKGQQAPRSTKSKRGPQYAGGLVLEPKRGLYEQFVLQLDFNSLYPSIIQEYNVCFTTVPVVDGVAKLPEAGRDAGVLPKVLRRLVEQRRVVKSQMHSEKAWLLRKQLETRQLAIKLTANSIYGCLGFENSRFYAKPLAELVTAQGRLTLQKTVELAQDKSMDVIYGDTDSLFINTGLRELGMVVARGSELKREVNRRYRTLEIEVEAVYARMLLLRKKKYAAMRIQDLARPEQLVREVKGLDLVRHDWCALSDDASEFALQQLLGKRITTDDAVANLLNFLTGLAEKVRSNRVSLNKYIITKSLTKMPEDYADVNNAPHVKVALRGKLFGKSFRTGDYVQYVVCRKLDGTGDGLADRCYHPEEVVSSQSKLTVDVEWYLSNQVLPPVDRLCDPIAGVDTVHLAEALKLDSARYHSTAGASADGPADLGEFVGGIAADSEERFAECEPWRVTCANCGKVAPFTGIKLVEQRVVSWGLECPSCGDPRSETVLMRQLQVQMRQWVKRYYLTPLEERRDDGTIHRHRNPTLSNAAATERTWSSRWLYLQLRYLMHVVDPGRGLPSSASARELSLAPSAAVLSAKKEDPRAREVYRALHAAVESMMQRNEYRYVEVSEMLAAVGLGSITRKAPPPPHGRAFAAL